MADTKLSALTPFTPVLGDYVYGVDDPGGTPASGALTLTSIFTLFSVDEDDMSSDLTTKMPTQQSVKAYVDAPKAVSVNAQTGTSYTLVLGDASKVVTMSNASANTLTIPTNASVAFPTGTTIVVQQIGAGTTSVEGATGVTVNGVSAGSGDLSAQWAGVSLYKTATNTWLAIGGIGTVA